MEVIKLPVNETEILREELAALKKENANLKTMLGKVDAVFFSVDMITNKLTYISSSCEKLYGFTPADFLMQSKLWFDVVVDEDKHVIEKNYVPMMAGERITHQHRIMTSNGLIKWVETKITPTLEGNLVVRIDGVTTDITASQEAEELLLQKEARFQQLIEKSHDGIALLSADKQLIYVSPSVECILGYSPEELIGVDAESYIHPDDQEEMNSGLLKAMMTPSATVSTKYRVRSKNNEWRWIHAKITNHLAEKNIRALVLNYADIDHEVKISEELEFSRKNHELLINSTPDLLWSFDAKGNMLMANKAFCDAMSYVTQQKIEPGVSLVNIPLPEETRQKWKGLYTRVLSGESFIYENHETFPEEVWGELSFNPLIENGKVIGGACVWRDITDKKRNHARLQASEKMMVEAQRISQLGSWELLLDEHDEIIPESISWSDEVYKIYDYDLSSDVDKHIATRNVDPEDKERVALWFEKVKVGSEDKTIEYKILTRNGRIRWVRTTADIIKSEGSRARMLGTVQDITERKLMELESAALTNDLIERNKALQQFAHIVSHNLRSPVANILGLSHLVNLEGQSEEDRRRCMEGLMLSAKRLDEITLDLGKILSVKRGILEDKENVNLSSIVQSIKESIHMLIDEEHVMIEADFTELESVFTVKNYMYSIFYNLISNSIKYKRPGVRPIITIFSQVIDDKTVLTFRDNGSGIDLTKHRDNLFGLYKRFHANSDGKGMGLFMIKTQVESLGGKITLNSEVNKGTTVRIEL